MNYVKIANRRLLIYMDLDMHLHVWVLALKSGMNTV